MTSVVIRRIRRVGDEREIHDLRAHIEEELPLKRLGKEISEIVARPHERDPNAVILDELAHEEMTTHDMLHGRVTLRVVSDSDRRLIVHEKSRRRAIAIDDPELAKQLVKVDRLT